ncbi:MFS general substrate transporter [Wallemia mellicola]|uniref:MFS general substrate transporter n=1 Tax=Wallemia mellicola TaxID=1708541 RepID=A0A4T0QU19_9BASI|nr:MFS general substrate transporter [Wallemia mellicola]
MSDDVAFQVKNELPTTVDKSIERRLLWKIDLTLMPLLFVSYGLQFFDKAAFGNAAVFGLLEDMDLTSERYSNATSVFYWGYITSLLFHPFALQKLPIGKYLSVSILVWGALTVVTIAVHSYPGIMVQRLILGIVEAVVSPGFVILSSMWYKKSEQPIRLAIWYSSTGIFTIFSGALNYGIGSAASKPSSTIEPWKAIYIFAGSWTMLHALIMLFLLPDNPLKARLLTHEERLVAVARIRDNMTGIESKRWKWSHVWECFRDPQVYAYFLLSTAIYMVNGPVTAFGAQIIKSFGYSSLKTILMTMPGGATTALSIWITAWIAMKCRNTRLVLLIISCLPVIVGAAIIWRASWNSRGVPLFGYYLLPIFGAPYVMILATNTSNVAGATKKKVTASIIFIGYNVGNIASPYLVDTTTASSHYPKAWIGVIVAMCIAILVAALLLVYFILENRRRDQADISEKSINELAFRDMTDIQNRCVRLHDN